MLNKDIGRERMIFPFVRVYIYVYIVCRIENLIYSFPSRYESDYLPVELTIISLCDGTWPMVKQISKLSQF